MASVAAKDDPSAELTSLREELATARKATLGLLEIKGPLSAENIFLELAGELEPELIQRAILDLIRTKKLRLDEEYKLHLP